MSAYNELERIERRQRRADARFRGEEPEEEESEELSAGELVLGGALVGLILLAVIAVLTGSVAGNNGRRRSRY